MGTGSGVDWTAMAIASWVEVLLGEACVRRRFLELSDGAGWALMMGDGHMNAGRIAALKAEACEDARIKPQISWG